MMMENSVSMGEGKKWGKKRLSRKKIVSRKDGMKEKQRGLIIYSFFCIRMQQKRGKKMDCISLFS